MLKGSNRLTSRTVSFCPMSDTETSRNTSVEFLFIICRYVFIMTLSTFLCVNLECLNFTHNLEKVPENFVNQSLGSLCSTPLCSPKVPMKWERKLKQLRNFCRNLLGSITYFYGIKFFVETYGFTKKITSWLKYLQQKNVLTILQ